jgi:hypothetical protein
MQGSLIAHALTVWQGPLIISSLTWSGGLTLDACNRRLGFKNR